jgi:hypothetical protein
MCKILSRKGLAAKIFRNKGENGRTGSPSQVFIELNPHGVTVKVPELVAVPPVLATTIFPVIAPFGTVAVT